MSDFDFTNTEEAIQNLPPHFSTPLNKKGPYHHGQEA